MTRPQRPAGGQAEAGLLRIAAACRLVSQAAPQDPSARSCEDQERPQLARRLALLIARPFRYPVEEQSGDQQSGAPSGPRPYLFSAANQL